jgi:hypothetical protein
MKQVILVRSMSYRVKFSCEKCDADTRFRNVLFQRNANALKIGGMQ